MGGWWKRARTGTRRADRITPLRPFSIPFRFALIITRNCTLRTIIGSSRPILKYLGTTRLIAPRPIAYLLRTPIPIVKPLLCVYVHRKPQIVLIRIDFSHGQVDFRNAQIDLRLERTFQRYRVHGRRYHPNRPCLQTSFVLWTKRFIEHTFPTVFESFSPVLQFFANLPRFAIIVYEKKSRSSFS